MFTSEEVIPDLKKAEGLLASGAGKAHKVRDGILWRFRGHDRTTEGLQA